MISRFWGRKLFDVLVGLFVSRGASKQKIDDIPTKEFSGSDVDSRERRCAVCLGDFELGEQVRNLPCTHTFHNECVDP